MASNNAQEKFITKSIQPRKQQVMDFLDEKLMKASCGTQASHGDEENSFFVSKRQGRRKSISPVFEFRVVGYSVGERVQYEIELREIFVVLGQRIEQVYNFKTYYTNLLNLSKKLPIPDFPGKKWILNKSPQFIQKRRKELQKYLNKANKNCSQQKEFITFILQIKQAHIQSKNEKTFMLCR